MLYPILEILLQDNRPLRDLKMIYGKVVSLTVDKEQIFFGLIFFPGSLKFHHGRNVGFEWHLNINAIILCYLDIFLYYTGEKQSCWNSRLIA